MKVACVYLDHFPVAVEQREDSSLIDKPLVVGGFPYERKPVYDFSPLAAEWGVKPGMPLRQAHGLCPLAVFLPVDEAKYQRAFSDVLNVLEGFSPYVEDASQLSAVSDQPSAVSRQLSAIRHPPPTLYPLSSIPGLAYLEVSGMEGLHGDDRTLAGKLARAVYTCFGVAPRVGLASNKFASQIGARRSSPGEPIVITRGCEAEFLAPLPVSILPCSDKMKLRLHRFGLNTVGQFASLPANEVIFQFEEEGKLAHRLAGGADDRPIVSRQHPPTVVASVEYDFQVESVEQILWSIELPVKRAIGALEKSYRLCQEVRLHLTFDNGEAWYGKTSLHEPTAKSRDIVEAVKRLITAVCGDARAAVLSPLPSGCPLGAERVRVRVAPGLIFRTAAGNGSGAACRAPATEGYRAPTSLTLILANLCGEKGRQLSLITDVKRWQALHRVVGELQRKMGEDCIKRPVIVDPLARLPERRFTYQPMP